MYKPKKAVLYCRVSSKKQVSEGSGLGSQETRCREYARYKGHNVIAVFQDDITGKYVERRGMMKMLSFLQSTPKNSHVVIIDDISRLARGLEAHIKLRQLISDAGGILESPSIEFGDDPDSLLHENLMASVSQHQREKNAEQTLNRMKARVSAGFNVTRAPYGYRYQKSTSHGKVLVRDEPLASIIQEALKGYATGRFQSQVEVRRFFESKPLFPRNKHGDVGAQHIKDILTRPIYAGYVHAPSWNISMRKGFHEGLISLAEFEAIQERLNGKAKVPTRKDLAVDFPLRGFVLCGDCNHSMTASWSKGKYKQYPYYRCEQKSCISNGKSANANKMHAEFKELLGTMTPSKPLILLFTKIFKDVWDKKLELLDDDKAVLKHELIKLDKQIDDFLGRIVEAESPTVMKAFDKRIQELEKKKLLLAEQIELSAHPKTEFSNSLRSALEFLSNPQKLWDSPQIEDKRAVLKLTFAEQLVYIRKKGFGTPKMSLPFNILEDNCASNFRMVPLGRIELPTSSLPMTRSTTELQRPMVSAGQIKIAFDFLSETRGRCHSF